MFHYTNSQGFNAIRSQVVWCFKAFQPPGGHPKAAYFTTLPPGTPNLGKRLFVRGCGDKLEFVFSFTGGEELLRLRGGRGEFVRYSEEDYFVAQERQTMHGPTEDATGDAT